MLRAGMSELDLAAEVASAMQRRGGQIAFPTIVCFGENCSEPHYSPGAETLKPGDMILVDFGAKRDDYCADITRTTYRKGSGPAASSARTTRSALV